MTYDISDERYQTILEQTLGEFEHNAGCIVDSASDTAIRFQVIASEFARLYDQLDYYKKQIFPDTAEGEFLDRHGAMRGILRKQATKSSGRVVFTLKSPAEEDILIPAGTLCTSSAGSGLMFQTVADITIKKGASYASGNAESTEAGSRTNIAAGRIDILVTPIAGVISVNNPDSMLGGADEEPEESYRRRVIEGFNKISNGANLNYYEQFARSKGDVWYAKAVFSPTVSNQIDLYVENYTRTLSSDIVADLQEEVEAVRELNIKVNVRRPTVKLIEPSITIQVDNMANQAAYAADAGDALYDAALSLSIGERYSPALVSQKLLAIPGILDVAFRSPTTPVEMRNSEIAGAGMPEILVEKG